MNFFQHAFNAGWNATWLPAPDGSKRIQSIRAGIKHRLGEGQGWRCCYCGVRMSITGDIEAPDFATFEHIVPHSRGGSNSVDNLMLACFKDNNARKNQSVKTFIRAALLAKRVAA